MRLYIYDLFLKTYSTPPVGTSGLGAERHRQGREVRKCWETDYRIVGFSVFMEFVDSKKNIE